MRLRIFSVSLICVFLTEGAGAQQQRRPERQTPPASPAQSTQRTQSTPRTQQAPSGSRVQQALPTPPIPPPVQPASPDQQAPPAQDEPPAQATPPPERPQPIDREEPPQPGRIFRRTLRGQFHPVPDSRDGYDSGYEVMTYSVQGFGPFVIVLNQVSGATLAGMSWRARPSERFTTRSRIDSGIEAFGYCVEFRDEGILTIPGTQNFRARFITVLQLVQPGACP